MHMRWLPSMLLALATAVHASSWQEASRGQGALARVDTESIKRLSPNKVRARVYWQYDTPGPLSQTDSTQFMSAKQLTVFDCAEGTSRVISLIAYAQRDDAGTSVASEGQPDDPRHYDYLAPDSMGEAVLKFTCGWKPRKKQQ